MIIDSPRRREHLAAIAERMPAHVQRLSWSADQIEAERMRALREMLAFAKAKSPWHASRLSRIDPDAFTEPLLRCRGHDRYYARSRCGRNLNDFGATAR